MYMNKIIAVAVLVLVSLAVVGYAGWHSRPYVVTGYELRAVGNGNVIRVEFSTPLLGRSHFDTLPSGACFKSINIGYSVPRECW